MSKVLLGMSGGVDSTYAARCLMEAGYTVEGAVLRMHPFTEIEEAQSSADFLGIPLHVIDAEELFSNTVIRDFCEAYQKGRTPNPCIVCNENVKFRLLYEEAMKRGFDLIATGHYAKIERIDGRYAVRMGSDRSKDQSYMLYRLPQQILERLIFPIGTLVKKEIKKTAAEEGIEAAYREESQEICFVKNESYAEYIERACGKAREGDFVDEKGSVLGRHKGIVHYTVGQRKGLGVSAPSRLFVQKIDVDENKITLSDTPRKAKAFRTSGVVFSGLSREEALKRTDLTVQVRYQSRMHKAVVREAENEDLVAEIAEEAIAVTPGQSAVFYLDDVVAFGGFIEEML